MSIFGASYQESDVRSGLAYRLSIFRQTLTAAQNFKITLTNPANSGVNMVVQSATTDSYASVVGSITAFRSPTAGLPTQAITTAGTATGIITPLNNVPLAGGIVRPPLVTVLANPDVSTSPMTGGTTSQQKPIYTNAPTKSDETIVILKPGSVLGVQIGGTVAVDFAYTLIWSEEHA